MPCGQPARARWPHSAAASPRHAAAGRLLLQRLRKSQSTTVLYGEPESALEQLQLTEGGSALFQQLDGGGSQRLIVVANRLPVSAYKDRGGRWQLQVGRGGSLAPGGACWEG
jgi:hypothetical protein